MQHRLGLASAGVALAVTLAAQPAIAQKSKDTVRAALYQPISLVDRIYNPQPETTLMTKMVADPLLYYDTDKRVVKPLLAKSYRRIDPKTIELTLRDDVKFHDGSEMNADDVIYTFNYVIDPKHNFRFKGTTYGWIDHVEEIDKHTVRVVSKAVFAPWYSRLTSSPDILPSDKHSALADKTSWGRAPIGTGPYKAIKVDGSTGVVLVKNDAFHHGGDGKHAAEIGRIEISPLPDQQTQIAKLYADQQDFVYNVPNDLIEPLRAHPNIDVSVIPSVSFSYIYFDAADRSGIHVLKNKKVREALLHAIDRKELVEAFVPKELRNEPLQKTMCHPWHIGCDSTAEPVKHDLAKAKQLLKEAGLEDGFDLEFTAWGVVIKLGEAVAGQLRKVGVRARMDAVTFGVYNKKRNASKVQTFISLWDNGGGQPDVDTTAGFMFLPSSRNYHHDKRLAELVHLGRAELDLEKRKAYYREMFDRNANEYYMMPLVPLPAIVAHNKDLVLEGGHKSPEGFEFNHMHWK